MLKNCLIDCDHEITVTNSFTDGVNFIYEGHHPDNYNETIKELKNKKNYKFIICTEEFLSVVNYYPKHSTLLIIMK